APARPAVEHNARYELGRPSPYPASLLLWSSEADQLAEAAAPACGKTPVNVVVGHSPLPAALVGQLSATEPADTPVALTTGMLISTDEFGLPTGTPVVAVVTVKPV